MKLLSILMLTTILTSCGLSRDTSELDNSIKELQVATEQLKYSTTKLKCIEVIERDLEFELDKFEIKTDDGFSLVWDALMLRCLNTKYGANVK